MKKGMTEGFEFDTRGFEIEESSFEGTHVNIIFQKNVNKIKPFGRKLTQKSIFPSRSKPPLKGNRLADDLNAL